MPVVIVVIVVIIMRGFDFNFFIKDIKTYESENNHLYDKLFLRSIR
jgi:hypothetical protein